MKFKFLAIWAIVLTIATPTMSSCSKDDGNNNGDGGYEVPKYPELEEDVDILPTPGAVETYSPSNNNKQYHPIMVGYSGSFPTVTNWTMVKTRVLPYLVGFTADTSSVKYKAATNRYGSSTQLAKHTVTGRFYTKKIDGRWWIIDPEGCMHYERSVTSFRKGSSSRNASAWNSRFGSNSQWLKTSQKELASIGFHGTGAFCTDAYDLIQAHNTSNPETPMTLTPSFGFLTQFRSKYKLTYPDGNSENSAGLAFHPDWKKFCLEYISSESGVGPYLNDKNVLGIFSDNEINFSTSGSKILTRFLDVTDPNDIARQKAEEFMTSKGATVVTDALNSEFAGIVAEAYYKGVKEALNEVSGAPLYLGSRLHGTPKYLQGVVEAAGRWCDIISINYYSRWSAELTTYVAKWAEWADKPFLVTEFYTKGQDSDLNNQSGAGFLVPTHKDRAYAYQHFTLSLLEAKNCVGWHWFKYQDDDGSDNSNAPANKGMYDNHYKMYPYLTKYAKAINYNAYELIKFFDE